MESRKLTVDADFATSVLCDDWNRKEEKSIISHLQFTVAYSEGSTSSIGSISSSSICDDDGLSSFSSSSSSSSSSSLSSTSSLLSQSELREQQVPIKKGLSKFYEGKSRTFSSLSDVKSIKDLAKRKTDHRKKDTRISPKATISKKHGRSYFATLVSKTDTLS
ncbi:uncharacterized protein E6C27_scaffold82G003850 [Cucumis melo var. makuwa]|uniref:Uncharacterized protein n=1 Tax=Cucumis melo var. makuwa TaxID=1194695 RepID=A0A5A7VFF0_CUCMM|nr:uncharacterized protein E6C27_scaffold82G003850 [Cucumis melo var. makuwa]